jgi:ACS family glucarate transporter-like MFS transporter
LALSVIVMAVGSLDRVNLSIAGRAVQDQFALSTQTLGWIFSGFFLGYAIFQVPAGYAVDRYGPRGLLALAILWWSVFTVAVGLAPHLALGSWFGVAWSMAVMRFMVGVGEAAAPPALTKVVALWMGEGQRAVGTSFMSAGLGLGGIFGPIFVVLTMQKWGWPSSFYLCGVIGVAVGLVWWRYVTNLPGAASNGGTAEQAAVRPYAANTAREHPGGTPWKKMFSSGSVWCLLVSYACQNYVYYVYYDWLYIYVVRARGLTMTKGGLWASTPFIAITVLALLGGRLSDAAVRRFGRRRGRQSIVWLGGGSSLALLLLAIHTHTNIIAIPLLAAAAGFNFFPVPTFYATCIDIMPEHSASLAASMNSFAHFAAWLSPVITAHIITRYGWTGAFNWAAMVTLIPGLIWFFVNAGRKLEFSGTQPEVATT